RAGASRRPFDCSHSVHLGDARPTRALPSVRRVPRKEDRMTRGKWVVRLGAVALAMAIVGAACSKSTNSSSGSFNGVALTGAGATFPAPIYSQWFTDFRKVESGAKVNYQAIGSGG